MYLPAIYRENVHLTPWFDVLRNPLSFEKVKSALRTRSFKRVATGTQSPRVTIHNQRPPGTPTFRIQTFSGIVPGHIVHRTD